MAVTLIRATLLYAAIIFLIRLMGKRQIGELQPSELVVTILLSEIASIPMQDNNIPIIHSVVALFVLVSYEILTSAIGLKSHKLRTVLQGHPVIVIRKGEIDMKALKKLRMTVNDLISALRQKDVFDVSQVSYAIFETNGQISVLLKPEYRNSTVSDLNLHPEDSGMPFAVICDGRMIDDTIVESGFDADKIKKLVISSKIPVDEIIIMTVTSDGKAFIARKGDSE
ncbi:MAG: DUF421 domain-containing protein [Clostridia bacterium]|nr:DUF421 domain-containing protein [Clostridia bacterium]MBR3818328.1 DUF421 domain-containing protein [Clostridia bacterium]